MLDGSTRTVSTSFELPLSLQLVVRDRLLQGDCEAICRNPDVILETGVQVPTFGAFQLVRGIRGIVLCAIDHIVIQGPAYG